MAEPFTDNPQVAAQVRQLLAERENAVAYENTGRVAAVDKQLAELGYVPDKKPAKDDAKVPRGRTARGPSTTAEG